MGYAAKYKIESGPRGWRLCQRDVDLKGEFWFELGMYKTEADAKDALKRTVSKVVQLFNEDGEAV
jgi:hypothetical protein